MACTSVGVFDNQSTREIPGHTRPSARQYLPQHTALLDLLTTVQRMHFAHLPHGTEFIHTRPGKQLTPAATIYEENTTTDTPIWETRVPPCATGLPAIECNSKLNGVVVTFQHAHTSSIGLPLFSYPKHTRATVATSVRALKPLVSDTRFVCITVMEQKECSKGPRHDASQW